MPYVRDDRETPLCVGRDGQSSRGDLGGTETEIFFHRGLDCPNQIDLVRQIGLSAQSWLVAHRGPQGEVSDYASAKRPTTHHGEL